VGCASKRLKSAQRHTNVEPAQSSNQKQASIEACFYFKEKFMNYSMKKSETLDEVAAVAAGVKVHTSGEGLGTETYEYAQLGDYTVRAAVASEMTVNGVQRSFEPRYTETV
jgi:hypothetical protein